MKSTAKKTLILTLVMVVIVALMVTCAVIGRNKSTSPTDSPSMTITSLSDLYDNDTRAQEDIATMQDAGILDKNGKMVDLDIRENGARVELAALTTRIANGETVGNITVNGKETTPEQVMKISQVSAALEIAELLDTEIDVTDAHVKNLETLLTGIQNGTIDVQSTLQTGALRLSPAGTTALRGTTTPKEETNEFPESIKYWDMDDYGAPEPISIYLLGDNAYKLPADTVDDGLTGYYGHYFNGGAYEADYFFEFRDPVLHENKMTRRYYLIDNRYTGSAPGTINTTGGKNAFIDWDNVKWGIDSSKGIRTTVTILLPLKSDDALQNQIAQWIANESGSCQTNGSGIAMTLPEPYGETTINYYMTSMYFGTQDYKKLSGSTQPGIKYPVYVVTSSDEKPVALVARYSPNINIENYLRKETVNLYMKSAIEPTGGFDWESSPTDPLGYHYYNGTSWSKVGGVSYSYYVGTLCKINLDQYVSRIQQYEDLQNGFIKVTDDNSDFPYVYLRDGSHPENQCDLEIRVTEDMYNILSQDPIVLYMGDDQDLRLTYQISNRADFDSVTPNEDIYYSIYILEEDYGYRVGGGDRLDPSDDGRVYTLNPAKSGDYSHLFLVAMNGNDITCTYTIDLAIKEGSSPYLNIPRSSRTRETMSGINTDIFFSSNAAQYNNQNTNITLKLYNFDGENINSFTPSGSPIYTTSGTSTVANPLTHITIPGDKLSTAGNYAVELSTNAGGALSAKALIKVKQSPAKITLDKLDSYAVEKDNIPEITYTLTSAANGATVKYTVQPSGGEVSEMEDVSDGTISFASGEFEGLKKAYTITVYARNTEADPWSVDSMILTVYNTNPLKLILKVVPFGELGGTTGGTGTEAGSSLVMDNSEEVEALINKLSTDESYSFDNLRSDINLQKLISINYGSGAWGIISDKMKWSATEGTGDDKQNSDRVTLNYEEGGNYADLRSYTYATYIPTSDFLIVATDDVSGDAPVTITATHAATGLKKDITVTVKTLKNKLYLFRFNPKGETTLTYYTTGSAEPKTATTNSAGELALYEPAGLTGEIVAISEVDGETYIGTIQSKSLVSGEQNVAKLEIYPCNNQTLKPISNTTLTFLKPDGKPYTGSVTLRGGVYVNGAYDSDAYVYTSKTDATQRYLRQDMSLTANASGKVNLWFNPTEFLPESVMRSLQYVFEYRFNDTYQPGYIVINAGAKDPAASIVNLKTLRGSGNVPTIVR
ncbi:MAG: hypothetical protein J5704_00300, partial [Paludibacteraceae bacterium]|nr:hypothetical protein [Paludibacteraceae bacterium]